MDLQELKYKFEDNKKQIMAGLSAVLGVALIGGGIWIFNRDRLYDETAGPEIILADYLLSHNSSGELDLYSIEDNTLLDTLALPKNVLVTKNQNLDGAYVYDKDGAMLSHVVIKNDKVSLEAVRQMEKGLRDSLEKATGFDTDGERFAFVSPESIVVLNEKTVITETDEEWKEADAWTLSDSGLYVAKGEKMSYVDFESGKKTEIEVGDTSTRLHKNGNYIMAHNNFGSGLDNSIILRLQPDSLHIEELKEVDSLNYVKPLVAGNENQLIFLSINYNDEGDALSKKLIVQNAVGTEKEANPIVLDLSTEGNMTDETTLARNGFLYHIDPKTKSISVSELRNGREFKRVDVKVTEKDGGNFFVPLNK